MTHTVDVPILWSAAVFIGEDKTLTLTVEDINDAIVNVSSWTFKWQLRLTRFNPNIILEKTTGSGISFVTDGSDGLVRVTLASANTVNLKAGTYYHGLARTNNGSWDVTAEGPFVLRKAAVHAA